MPTQLRRYVIAEGQMDRFIEWFPNIIPAREAYGFTVDWAYADRENNEFVWATSHPDDFDGALAVYNDSKERAAAFQGFESPVMEMHVAMVDRAL